MPKSSVEQLRDNLTEIEDIKGQIRQAIIAKETEVPLDTPFSEYPQKIEGIQTKEDLDDVLNTQDEKIAQLEAALENKTAGANVKLNIYAQTTEPTNKNGIWLQTDKTFDKIYFERNIIENEQYYNVFPSLLSNNSFIPIQVDNYIYLIYSDHIDRYDISTNTIENFASNISISALDYKNGCAIGNKIYLLGSSGYSQKMYCYDLDNKTGTSVGNTIPFRTLSLSNQMIAYDGNIYIFAPTGGTNIYKYDIQAGTYTLLQEVTLPENIKYGIYCLVNDDVYIFNLNTNGKAGKFNLTNYTFSYLPDLPSELAFTESGYRTGACYDNNIYLFYKNLAYKFDILTQQYTKLTNSIFTSSSTKIHAFIYENRVYCFEHCRSNSLRCCIILKYKTFENNSLIISQGNNKYFTELISNDDVQGKILYPFNNAWFYTIEDGLIADIPTYYGDGTQWIKFKN